MNSEYIKKVNYLIFFAAFILYNSSLLAVQSLNTPYYHLTYTIADGISSNFVNFVYKDSRGFLWIGTDRGP